jgi:hypothetical protein
MESLGLGLWGDYPKLFDHTFIYPSQESEPLQLLWG